MQKHWVIVQSESIIGRRFYVGPSPMGGREWTSNPADAAKFTDPLTARMLIERLGLESSQVFRPA